MIHRNMVSTEAFIWLSLLVCTAAHQDEVNCVAQDGVEYVDCVSGHGGGSGNGAGESDFLEPTCCEFVDFNGINGVVKVKSGSPIFLELSSINIPDGVEIFIKNVMCWQTEGCKVIALDSSASGKIYLSLNGPKFSISSHNKAASMKWRLIGPLCRCENLLVLDAATEIQFPSETDTSPENIARLIRETKKVMNKFDYAMVEFKSVTIEMNPDNSLKGVVKYWAVHAGLLAGKRAVPRDMQMEMEAAIQEGKI